MGILRKRVLSKKEKKFEKDVICQFVFDHASTPVLIFNEKHELSEANTAAIEFFHIREEDKTQKFHDFFEITKEDAWSLLGNIIGGLSEETCQLVAKNNSAICKVSVTPMTCAEGDLTYIVVFVHDVTEDYQTIERLKTVKSSLEKQLEEKSKQVERVALQAVTTVANFIDSKEEYNYGHSTRVARYAEAIAREMGWSAQEATNLHYIALLHDIGKIGVPIQVLNKITPLTVQEQELVKKHTEIGAEILKDIKTVEGVNTGALYHHERYDGQGYPNGLAGQEIPLIARIIAMADAYDGMTSKREYKDILDEDAVVAEIEANAGTQFDPYIASLTVRMIKEGIFEELKDKQEDTDEDNLLFESNALMAKLMGGELESTKAEAESDYLTQIWNRRTGEKHIQEYLRIGDGALMIIDLDNFKMVNDTFGHLSGDHVLKEVADILRVHGKHEYVCRMAGDEFLLFVRDAITPEDTKQLLDAIMYAFNSRKERDEVLAHTSLSIGIALSSVEGRDYKKLFRCADRALYYVKQNGKGGYSFHNRSELGGGKNAKVDLDRLVTAIKAKEQYSGSYRVEYQRFLQTHEFVAKFAKRNHQNIQLVLLTIDFDESLPMEYEEKDVVMRELETSVSKALRGVDISTRFSSAQLLVLLMDTNQINVPQAVQRMLKDFYLIYRPTDVKVSFETADITTYE